MNEMTEKIKSTPACPRTQVYSQKATQQMSNDDKNMKNAVNVVSEIMRGDMAGFINFIDVHVASRQRTVGHFSRPSKFSKPCMTKTTRSASGKAFTACMSTIVAYSFPSAVLERFTLTSTKKCQFSTTKLNQNQSTMVRICTAHRF